MTRHMQAPIDVKNLCSRKLLELCSERTVASTQLGAIIDLISGNTISGKIAKDLFEIVWTEGGDPAEVVARRGLRQVTDTGAIEAAVDKVLAANADNVAEYRSGKDKLFGFFVGQVMKAMQGKGNPALVNEALKKKLA